VLAQPDHEYAAIYEICARTEEDLERAVERLNELGASGISVNPAFDNSRTMATFMLPISDKFRTDPAYRHSGTVAA
jgi:alkylhydroperoxidase family enzyme